MSEPIRCDTAIVGGGIAGITAALELLERNQRVCLLDRDTADQFGGLARRSSGGLFFVDTPQQRFAGARDSPALALRDWTSFAEFGPDDMWPHRWAEQYVHRCTPDVYRWLREHSVQFFPVVHWVERGLHQPGNSVPRFHMVWGTGKALTETLIVEADQTIIAAGGICGNIDRLKRHWHADLGAPPETVLDEALTVSAEGTPVLVDVNIDYSRRTRLTKGVVKTNLDRFSTGEKVRFLGRAAKRHLFG